MRAFKALLKREYWEHRGSMFYSPLILAGFIALVMLIAGITDSTVTVEGHHAFSFGEGVPMAMDEFEKMDAETQERVVQVGLTAPVILFSLILLVVCLFYALGCLYDERRDRSILFWKSMPLSDTTTVLSKFVTLVLVIPALYGAVIIAFQLYTMLYATVAAWFGGNSGVTIWAASGLIGVFVNTLLSLIVASLWLAPVWGWLMLASCWAKRTAFLWAIFPLLLVFIAEGWIFNSSRFASLIGERIATGFAIQNSEIGEALPARMSDGEVFNWINAIGNTEFWSGLLLTAAFLGGAIYLRRYRDDS